MTVPTRIFGTDGEEIADLASWFDHAPPEKGAAQWRDGYSAKEQAKAWLRDGSPAVPPELWAAIAALDLGEPDQVYARPEHQTKLDDFARKRRHDMFACARRGGETQFVIGIEAKACEDFAGLVSDRAAAAPPSNKRARCNLLGQALFGRQVTDEESGELLDTDIGAHGYQLWTAAVGSVVEAQKRGLDDAVLVVHQFRPEDPSQTRAGDTRDWDAALAANHAQFSEFERAVEESGSRSHETPFVQPGTRLHVIKVETALPAITTS
jgi:Domain of unknown function (DUF6946)